MFLGQRHFGKLRITTPNHIVRPILVLPHKNGFRKLKARCAQWAHYIPWLTMCERGTKEIDVYNDYHYALAMIGRSAGCNGFEVELREFDVSLLSDAGALIQTLNETDISRQLDMHGRHCSTTQKQSA